MSSINKYLFLLLILSPFWAFAADCHSKWLVPAPKKVELKGDIQLAPLWEVSCPPEFNQAIVPWLKETLKKKYGWKEQSTTNSTVIDIEKNKIHENTEAYILKIKRNHISITANTVAGINRAIGRIVFILNSPLVTVEPDHTLRCPSLMIKDWPDMKIRGMHLQMEYLRNPTLICKAMDTLAMLGYNMAVMSVGGSVENKEHPEIVSKIKNGPWKLKELKYLSSYARSRGLLAVPGINSIGHMDRAPQIFPIKDDKGRKVAMNIFHPKFYQIYFDYIDAIVTAFDNPPYFHIGTDEFHQAITVLRKLTDKRPEVFYAEFVNKVSNHLAKRKVKTVIWGDMLLEKGKYPPGEPANGTQGTFKALNNLNNNIVIDYWAYTAFDEYESLKLLLNKPNDLWVSPWMEPKAIYKLCHYAWVMKISSVLGTTWTSYLDAQDALILTADYAWNASKKSYTVPYDPWDIANFLSYQRPSGKIYSNISQINFHGGKEVPFELKEQLKELSPDGFLYSNGVNVQLQYNYYLGTLPPVVASNLTEVLKLIEKTDTELFVCNPLDFSDALKINGVNKQRKSADVILYTPECGLTNTNHWGFEYIVKDGSLFSIEARKGNAVIPERGYVISMHNAHGHAEYWLRSVMRENDRILLVKPKKVNKALSITSAPGSIKKDMKRFVLFISKCFPADNTKQVGSIEVTYADGRKNVYELAPALDKISWKRKFGNNDKQWSSWIAMQVSNSANYGVPLYKRIVAVEWTKENEKDIPVSITLTASKTGVQSGLTLLGAIQF